MKLKLPEKEEISSKYGDFLCSINWQTVTASALEKS